MTSITIFGLAGLVCLMVLVLFQKCSNYLKNSLRINRYMKKYRGPKPHWLLGNMADFKDRKEVGIRKMKELAETYQTSYVAWLGIKPILICTHPTAAKAVLRLSTKDELFRTWLKPWLGTGLVIEEGMRWARNRKVLTPAFHFDILKGYVQIYNQCVDVLLDKWASNAVNHNSLDAYPHVKLMSFDVILQCAFSLVTNCQTSKTKHTYVDAVENLTRLFAGRFLNPLHFFDIIYNMSSDGKKFRSYSGIANEFADRVIEKRKNLLDSGEIDFQAKKHLDFVDILLTAKDEDGQGLQLREIRSEVDTFMFAGHETVSSAISWTLYCLAKHKTHQDQIRQEVSEVIKGKGKIDYEDLSSLSYTTMCIKEALRLYPPVPNIARELDHDVEIDGKIAPKGCIAQVPLLVICQREDLWPNSELYDPQRFSAENISNRDPYAFIPFAAGPRNCIGQNFAMNEIKVVIGRIINEYRLKLDENRPTERCLSMTTTPDNGIWLYVEKV